MNSRGNDFAIRSEEGHWKHSYHCHEYTVGGIAYLLY